MKSIALICPTPEQVALQETDLDDPGEQEIQMRVHSSVISQGTERAFILNLQNTNGEYPKNLGYSASGVVEKVGSKVTRFRVGQRVAGRFRHCSIGNIHEDMVVGFPDDVSFEQAAFLPLAVIALQGVRKARIELGESVMVLGLGMMGQLAIQLARLNGAIPAIGVNRSSARREIALQCGSDFVLDPGDANWRQSLDSLTDQKGPHVVIESTGFPEAISTALESVRLLGRVILLGSTRGESTVNFYRDVHHKASAIIGAHIHGNPTCDSYPGFWSWKDDAQCTVQLLQRKKLHIDPLITDRFAWKEAETVYKEILCWNSNILGAVIQWNN